MLFLRRRLSTRTRCRFINEGMNNKNSLLRPHRNPLGQIGRIASRHLAQTGFSHRYQAFLPIPQIIAPLNAIVSLVMTIIWGTNKTIDRPLPVYNRNFKVNMPKSRQTGTGNQTSDLDFTVREKMSRVLTFLGPKSKLKANSLICIKLNRFWFSGSVFSAPGYVWHFRPLSSQRNWRASNLNMSRHGRHLH